MSCPYRKEHEWGEDGLCVHCYTKRPVVVDGWTTVEVVFSGRYHKHKHRLDAVYNQDVMTCRCGARVTGLRMLQAGVPTLDGLPDEKLEELLEYGQ